MNNFDPETKEYYLDNNTLNYKSIKENDRSDLIEQDPVKQSMAIIKNYCDNHPTCKGCDHNDSTVLGKPGGCDFRYHSPREWKL